MCQVIPLFFFYELQLGPTKPNHLLKSYGREQRVWSIQTWYSYAAAAYNMLYNQMRGARF